MSPDPSSIKGVKRTGSPRIIVIDDDPFQLEFLSDLLHDLGLFDVSTAPGGQAALQTMQKSALPFDLMLVDLSMPDMDGFQFMEAVAKRGFSGGLIIVSGMRSDVLRSASLVAKLQRFNLLGALPKPASKHDLSELLAKWR